ncbi:DUF7373 family lipoprotein [Nocardia sp. CA-084685]|uniref:DUF7373 family lipoprotein n=1 Tax=Nocardia sp. CA-084685 TaxID=3239970 RepID=UPI003D953635
MRFRNSLYAIIAVALAASTACGDTKDTTTPTIDISKLDSGNYPTTPRDMESTRTTDSGANLESVRIGNSVPLPFEIDGKFAFQRLASVDGRTTLKSPATMTSIASKEFPDLAQGLVAGWESSGERRKNPWVGSSVIIDTLRFSDAAKAETAVRRLADRQAEVDPGETVTIPGHPSARAKWSPVKRTLDSFLAHDSMLLYVYITDPVSEPVDTAPLIAFTQAAFTKSIEALKNYSPTPIEQLASLPLDTDGLLGRTLPLEDRQMSISGIDRTRLMTARSALPSESFPALSKAAFDDAGVDLVAYSGEKVFRTRDVSSTVRLIAALIDQRSDGYRSIEAPPNLPDAKCFDTKDKKTSELSYPPVCYLAYDRYVAKVQGTNVQEAYQKAAAQYKLLAYGR